MCGGGKKPRRSKPGKKRGAHDGSSLGHALREKEEEGETGISLCPEANGFSLTDMTNFLMNGSE